MKLTKLKISKTNKKLNHYLMEQISNTIVNKLALAGFITEGYIINSSRIDFKQHMRSFSIDINKLGYNASFNPHMNYKAGYKRTNTPTWNQRVHYNNIINTILTNYDISCNIKSGEYIIREGIKEFTENDWNYQRPDYEIQNKIRGFNIKRLVDL